MSNKRQRRNAKLRLIAFKKNEQFKNLYGVDIHKDIYKNDTKKFIKDNAKIEEIDRNDIEYKSWSKWAFNRYMSMNAHSKAYVCSNIKRMTKEDIAIIGIENGNRNAKGKRIKHTSTAHIPIKEYTKKLNIKV